MTALTVTVAAEDRADRDFAADYVGGTLDDPLVFGVDDYDQEVEVVVTSLDSVSWLVEFRGDPQDVNFAVARYTDILRLRYQEDVAPATITVEERQVVIHEV